MSCFKRVISCLSSIAGEKTRQTLSLEAMLDWEPHCWLFIPWTHSPGPLAPCGKACHSESGWHCLCGRNSWSSRARAPAEAHQRCLTLESQRRSASLDAMCVKELSKKLKICMHIHRGQWADIIYIYCVSLEINLNVKRTASIFRNQSR